MTAFNEYQATQHLIALARDPVDLSAQGVLSPKRIHQMVAEGLGLKLIYGTERVNEGGGDQLYRGF